MKEKNVFPKGYDKTGEDRFVARYRHRMTGSVVLRRKPQPKDCPFTREEIRLYTEDLPKMVRAYAKRKEIEWQAARDFIAHYRDSLPRYKTTTFRGKQTRGQSEIKYMIERLQVRIQGLRSRRMSLIEEVGLLDHEIDDITKQLNSYILMKEVMMERTKIVTGTLEDRRAIDRIFKEMTSGDLYDEVLKETGWYVATIDDQSTMTDYQTKTINQIEIGINLQSQGFAEARVMIHKGLLWINTGRHMRGLSQIIKMLKDMVPACSDQDQIALVREWLGEVKLHHLVECKDLENIIVNGCEPLPMDWDSLAKAILDAFVGPSEPLSDLLANELQDRFMTFVQMKGDMKPTKEPSIDVAKNQAWMSHIPTFGEFQNDIMKIFAEHLRAKEMQDKIVRYADRPFFITVKED